MRKLTIFVLAIAGLGLLGCNGHIGWYSNYEIADEIAKEQGPEKAEKWLSSVVDPEQVKLWRKRYDMKLQNEVTSNPTE